MYTLLYVTPESAKGNGTKYPKQNSDRLDYGKNPDKPQKGQLIRSYACDPETADAEFALSKREGSFPSIYIRFLKNYGYSYIMYFVRLYPHGGSI